MADTNIEWTDKVWNAVRGCAKVSAGCANCYAERMASRFSGPGQPYEGLTRNGKWTGEARFIPEMLAAPLKWKEPCRVFVNSMSDLFHHYISNEQIAAVFGVMAACPQHTFQVLTKRPQRMLEWFEWCASNQEGDGVFRVSYEYGGSIRAPWPLPNVHLGVSVENQAAADERIPLLLQCPAAVRWVSAEPLLGAVDLSRYMWPTHWHWDAKYRSPEEALANGGKAEKRRQCLILSGSVFVDWVVTGGESGPNARPLHPEWARSLRDQCEAAGVPFFFKQWGEWAKDDSGDRCVMRDGQNLPNLEPNGNNGYGAYRMRRIGKKSAGCLLDGVEHKMFPGDKW